MKDLVTRGVLFKGGTPGGLYSLPASVPVAFLSSKASSHVLHGRLGHLHAWVLNRILMFCSVDRSSSVNSSRLCSTCQLGKSTHFTLPRVHKSSSNVLDLIYTDIWGSSPILSSDGYHYFVIFVDDFSRYTWFYPMSLKSDIHSIFEKFCALVKCQFSNMIKSIQIYLGGEYYKLGRVFASLGIHHRQSCVYTHEQNGWVEHRHCHIVETGLTLLAYPV